MPYDTPFDSEQISMLAKILNDYCNEAGIPEWHPARERFGRRLMDLFQSGLVDPNGLKAKMNAGYEEWLGEIGASDHFTRPKLSSDDRLVGDNILPGSDRRGRPADHKSNAS